MKWYVLDDAGNPRPAKDVDEVEACLRDESKRTVARTEIFGGEAIVTTEFTPIDYDAWSDGFPLLWRTRVREGSSTFDVARHASRADAVVGHERIVAHLRARGPRNLFWKKP